MIDDGEECNIGHAVLGFSDTNEQIKNHLLASSGNLEDLFLLHQVVTLDACPFEGSDPV